MPSGLAFVAALSSGLLAVLVSSWLNRRFVRQQAKIDALREFSANRYDLHSDAFSRALNQIVVVFNDSPEVMRALQKFHRDVTAGRQQATENSLIKLFKAMCDDAGVELEEFNDSFFLRPFNTSASSAAQLPTSRSSTSSSSP